MKNLHDAASPKRMTQLIVPSASIQDSSGDASALEPGIIDVLLDFKTDFFHNVDFDFVTPSDAPRTAVLDSVLRARSAGASASTVDSVFFHGCPVLGLVLVGDVEL